MTSIDVDTIAGPDGDSFKFDEVGDLAKGTILHIEKMVRESRFTELDEEVLRIALEQEDGETTILWPVINTDVNGSGYATNMAKAIAAGVRAADRTTLEAGGQLAVKYNSDKDTGKGNAQKIFVSQYKPPAVAVAKVEAPTPEDDGAVSDLI